MLISLNEIKKYVPIPDEISTDKLLSLIGSRLVEIEAVQHLAPKYQGIYIAKVVSAEKIPDTHLTICQIDVGEETAHFVKPDSDMKTVQVVCGAPNVHAGMLAVWIAPGSIVPSTYGNENFKLSVRKLRGYESNGMLAAADELDLGSDHSGIAEIDPKTAQPGDHFVDVFELDDVIIDVENKSLTHRPDCFGLIGFAREVAGVLGLKFEEPTWPKLAPVHDLPLTVKITDSELCPRYSCAVFDLPKFAPTKYLTYDRDVFLAKAGMRSIDPMVDLTNIIMLRTGQPLHAFDYDKLLQVGGVSQASIIVRAAKPGEELQLLDGKTIECTPDDILITSNDVPVALAGAMGGKNTEIDASTERVVLESATFSLYHLRKTQMAHGIFSEAITRFTKGQPAAMTLPVLAKTLTELSDNLSILAVVDEWSAPEAKNVVKITTEQVNQLLGTAYSAAEIAETLENVGFAVTAKPLRSKKFLGGSRFDAQVSTLSVTVPDWRTDIAIPEDIIEEVGRLRGFDNIPQTLPLRSFSGIEVAPLFALKHELRSILSDRLAMHELLTYSFVSRDLIDKTGLDSSDSYAITNSISPELQRFRPQIVPSLLDKIRENVKAGYHHFSLYEMNQVTQISAGLSPEETPLMSSHLGIVELADFYQLKAQLLALFAALRIEMSYTALTPEVAKNYPYLEPKRSAAILLGQTPIAAFGEVKHSVLRNFKLDQVISACELSLDAIVDSPRSLEIHPKISRFPFVERDITFRISAEVEFGRFYALIDRILENHGLIFETQPTSIYQASPSDATMNISFHLRFSSPDKTLAAAEISAIMETITVEAAKIGAETI